MFYRLLFSFFVFYTYNTRVENFVSGFRTYRCHTNTQIFIYYHIHTHTYIKIRILEPFFRVYVRSNNCIKKIHIQILHSLLQPHLLPFSPWPLIWFFLFLSLRCKEGYLNMYVTLVKTSEDTSIYNTYMCIFLLKKFVKLNGQGLILQTSKSHNKRDRDSVFSLYMSVVLERPGHLSVTIPSSSLVATILTHSGKDISKLVDKTDRRPHHFPLLSGRGPQTFFLLNFPVLSVTRPLSL